MDLNSIEGFISAVGFPILACIFLFLYTTKRDKAYTEKLDKMRETVDNNTRAMKELKQSTEQANREMTNVISELLRYLQRGERKNE